MTDVNRKALGLARINAGHAGIAPELIKTSGLDGVEDRFDLIVANPPYILDPDQLTYRDGGGLHGGEVSVQWARAALPRLTDRGRFVLYTGVAIIAGADPVREALDRVAAEAGFALRYRELDPDIFSQQLGREGYEDVERIAAVAAVFQR